MQFPSEHADKVKGGHILEWDPPAALTATHRWTCADPQCGRAVLIRDNIVYGSATVEVCGPW